MIARALNPLLRTYVALSGAVTAYTVGLLDSYTAEHLRFLASGFICDGCKEFLIKKTLVADVIVLDSNGNSVPLLLARLKGKHFVCPRCGHRWELRRTKRLA